MIEILIFIAGQLLINLIIHFLHKENVTYVFSSFAPLIFSILMLAYPIWSWQIYDLLNPTDTELGPRCGNMQLGAMLFQWTIGTPIVFFIQRILNKYIHKINLLVDKFEKKQGKNDI